MAPNQIPTPPPAPAPAPALPAAQPLIAILPRRLVIVIAMVGLVLVTGLLVWALARPEDFDGAFARFVLSVGLSLYLAVFLFIIYPWEYRLTKIPYIDLSVELAGPVVLCIALFWFFFRVMPAPEGGQLHLLGDSEGQEIASAGDISIAKLRFAERGEVEYHFIPIRKGEFLVGIHGVYLRYPEGVTRLKAWIKPGLPFKEQEVEFRRYDKKLIRLKLEKV